MAHTRRKFVEALDAADARATIPVRIIQRLYAVEAGVKEAPPELRCARMQADSAPLMRSPGAWLKEMVVKVSPKTPLGRAITYAMKQWTSLPRLSERREGPD